NADDRGGARSINEPYAWAEVKGAFPLPLYVFKGDETHEAGSHDFGRSSGSAANEKGIERQSGGVKKQGHRPLLGHGARRGQSGVGNVCADERECVRAAWHGVQESI